MLALGDHTEGHQQTYDLGGGGVYWASLSAHTTHNLIQERNFSAKKGDKPGYA